MKKLILLFTILIIQCQGLFSQGTYVPIPLENYTTFYGDCNLNVRLPQNAPWYVFSDREDNPIFSTENGWTVVKKANLGDAFLVIGNSGVRLQVIDADKVIYNQINRTWQFRAGNNNGNVVQGWIPREKLLLNQKCLKVCDVGIPSAPTGLFNLQGLYVYNVASTNQNYRFFTHVPGTYEGGVGKTELNIADRFGYIYKVMKIGTMDWYLVGQSDEIRVGDRRIVLKGWKPQNQIELWKHRLALEYNWEDATSRNSQNNRLKVLRNNHAAAIPSAQYASDPFIDAEYNYKQGSPSTRYYFERDLGTGFRHVILEENNSNYKVGVLKNTCNVDPQIINPAREIASIVMTKLLNPKVIFVLDGTQSLTPQVPNIINTITTTAGNISRTNLGTAINYEYGVSIYRDRNYTQVFENRTGFSSNIADITSWLTTNLPHTNGTDCDQPEAIFYGLNKTIDYFEGLPDAQKSFFNPTFYVLIGDAGSHDPDMEGVTAEMIKTKLKSNVSDLVAIQFSHALDRFNCNRVMDNGISFDLFRTQFSDILSIYGNTDQRTITGGTKVTCNNRPGSFLAYPGRASAFGSNDLSTVIQEALLNYNNTIQEKVIHLALMLRDTDTSSGSRRELRVLVQNMISNLGLSISTLEIDQIVEWVIRFLENAANNIVTNRTLSGGANVQISTSCSNFFNAGYVSLNYNFLQKPPYKHVIYMNSNNLDRIIEFSDRIARLAGGAIKPEIQKIWYHMLITSLGIYQTPAQVNALTISEATSLLTGFKSNSIYDNIHIGEITAAGRFPNELLFRYVFEWAITNRYLQGVKNGSWQLTPKNLTSLQPIINAIRHSNNKPNITPAQIAALSRKLERKDNRTLGDYYKEYPQEVLDPLYKLKAFWIEADFFSTRENDFVDLLR